MKKIFQLYRPPSPDAPYFLRPMIDGDKQTILYLLRLLWPPDRHFDDSLFQRMLCTWVACDGCLGPVVGTASAGRDSLDRPCIHWVAVHPGHRRHHLARGLINQILDYFRDEPCIYVSTNPTTPENEALYLSMGFREWEVLQL
jgi:GNAT superfamily N-acetyltransferase